jgi:hypothetical protein
LGFSAIFIFYRNSIDFLIHLKLVTLNSGS